MEDIIIGRNPILEAIKAGHPIEKIFLKKGKYEVSVIPVVKKAKAEGIIIQEVDKVKLDRLADGGNHQGVVAVAGAYAYSSVEDILERAEIKGEEPFVFICDGITDPHNMGAIIRTANCAGAHGVIIPKRGSAGLNSVVAKASAGALEHTPVAKVTNLSNTIESLKKRGLWFVAADMDGDCMYNIDMKGAVGLVIGSEGSGISRLVREKCDFIASIPLKGEINSLNASVAAGILAYETVRQRGLTE